MKFFERILIISIVLLIVAKPMIAQVLYDTEPADSSIVVNEVPHSPKKAAIYSAVLPGLGQAYNKKYWKIPLVYIGFTGLIYFIGWNNDFYNTYKQGYIDITDDDANTMSFMEIEGIEQYDLTDAGTVTQVGDLLLKSQDYYRRNRDLLVISTALFYALNIIDASVDAHFFNLDLSDDLTFEWQPTIQNFNNEHIYSIHCSITF